MCQDTPIKKLLCCYMNFFRKDFSRIFFWEEAIFSRDFNMVGVYSSTGGNLLYIRCMIYEPFMVDYSGYMWRHNNL